jgi:hypothetical protein
MLGEALGAALGEALGEALGLDLGETLGKVLAKTLRPTMRDSFGPREEEGDTWRNARRGGGRSTWRNTGELLRTSA